MAKERSKGGKERGRGTKKHRLKTLVVIFESNIIGVIEETVECGDVDIDDVEGF